ncbi:MAG TPA: hypothetical protein VGO96_10060 [Pyrinomonadaceae bacterium]|nr:hypothetical protein [Pyrinomonadaceae bacterium]
MERAADIGQLELHPAATGARRRDSGDDSSSRDGARAWPFALVALALISASAIFAGWMPLRASIVTVFLFAGPHNWFELRYFLARLPARLGRSRNFFILAGAGIATLLATYAAIPLLGEAWLWSDDAWTLAVGVWNSLLISWLAALVWMRGRQSARRDWSWSFAAALALIGVNWLAPQMFSLALVYLHPLVALWFLERHLRRTRPVAWRRAYHLCLATLPLFVGLLWWQLASAPALAATGQDALALRITRHAGSEILRNTSSHLLVATHVFLETIHYSVWLLALPLVGGLKGGFKAGEGAPWRFESLPLVRHPRRGWPRLIRTVLVASAACVVLLWLAFLADYPTTRDLYFTLAMAHVLAEAPFLLRML